MPCYHPLLAYKAQSGEIVWDDRFVDTVGEISLPCGRCIGCRLERSRQWAIRCVHEASLHRRNCFVTLTYAELSSPSLQPDDFNRFIKRIRKRQPVRYYMCGEYGPQLQRPHFHACLFGVDFDDRLHFGTGESGESCDTSAELQRLWPHGFSTVGDLTFQTAAYTARYCVQKRLGKDAKAYYGSLEPEYNRASLRPGIGFGFFQRWQSDIYPADHVVVNALEIKPPRYYARLYRSQSAFADQLYQDEIGHRAEVEARSRYLDNTPERLMAKEQVAQARANMLLRSL